MHGDISHMMYGSKALIMHGSMWHLMHGNQAFIINGNNVYNAWKHVSYDASKQGFS